MTIRSFIRKTQLNVEYALYASRHSLPTLTAERTLEAAALEERILMSASPVAVVSPEVPQADVEESTPLPPAVDSELSAGPIDDETLEIAGDSIGLETRQTQQDAAARQRLELVFVDEAVDGLNQLLEDLQRESGTDENRQLEIVVIDSDRDGIAQVTAALIRHQDGGTFTQDDINSGRVTYDHQGAELFSDSFDFTVDDGTGTGTAGTFTITITPVNDNDPQITSDGAAATAALNVAENTTAVTTVTATDSDLPAQTLSYSITGGADSGRFVIDSVSGVLSFAAAPDFEAAVDGDANNIYEVVVRVSDGLGRTDQQTLQVTVTDVDEFDVSAITDTNPAADSVSENAVVGTAVGVTAFAQDGDGTNSGVTYSLDDDASGLFTIDSITGVVTTAAAVDYETTGSAVDLVVRCTSEDGSSTTRGFTVNVLDQNDNAPVISPGQLFRVQEHASVGTSLGVVAASDIDTLGTLRNWTILSGNTDGIFALNGITGELTVSSTAGLNFESTPSYILTLEVSDGVNTSATQTVTVEIADQNDAPVFSPSGPFTLPENTANGTSVGFVAAVDVDAGDSLSYSILSGTPGQPFAVDSISGLISVADAAQLDFEVTTSFSISIEVRDSGGLTDTQVVTVDLSNVNETPHDLTLSGTAVNENATVGTVVGTLTGTDVDASEVLSYSLLNSAGGRFAVNSSSGLLTVANGTLLNYEARTSHTINVRVTDAGGLFHDGSFTIIVSDVNEAPTAAGESFDSDVLQTLTVTDSVLANDGDVDGDALTAVLVATPANGVVTLNADGTFEYTPTGSFIGMDSFTYTASDGTLQSDPVTVNINVRGIGTGTGSGDGGGDSGSTGSGSSGHGGTDGSGTDGEGSSAPPNDGTSSPAGGSPAVRAASASSARDSAFDGFARQEDGNAATMAAVASEFVTDVWLDRIPVSSWTDRNAIRLSVTAIDPLINALQTTIFGTLLSDGPAFSDLLFDYHTAAEPGQTQSASDGFSLYDSLAVGSSVAVSTSVSVGYVIWMMRGGSLLTAFMSSIPAWQSFDPLAVIETSSSPQNPRHRNGEDPEADDDQSLASLVSRD